MVGLCRLDKLSPGERAVVKKLYTRGSMRRRLLDIGLTEQTQLCCVGKSPLGDPRAFLIRGAVIALRGDDCREIEIEVCKNENL